MTGVAGPMFARSRRAGWRFLLALLLGELMSGALLGIALYVVGSLVRATGAPVRARVVALALVCLGLGLADLANRTPHVWRQVPQRLVTSLTPGALGLAWGFDLGLHATTQKVSSLIWVSMAAYLLLDPASAPALLVVVALTTSVGVIVASVLSGVLERSGGVAWNRLTQRTLRGIAGAMILLLGGLASMQLL